MSVAAILLIIAVICFLISSTSWPTGPINTMALGLFFFALSFLVGASGFVHG